MLFSFFALLCYHGTAKILANGYVVYSLWLASHNEESRPTIKHLTITLGSLSHRPYLLLGIFYNFQLIAPE